MKTISKLALAAVLLCLCGCPSSIGLTSHDTVSVRTKVPNLDVPDRPVLDAMSADELTAYQALPQVLRDKLEGNNSKLQVYAQKLEVTIKDYNTWATTENGLSNASVGVK